MMEDDYSALFTYGNYGTPGYDQLFKYGAAQTDYGTGGGGWMPGMTSGSPSYGNPNSLNYTPPGLAGDKAGWGGLSALGKMSVIGQGVQAFSTLANLYAGFKSMQAQKDQFKFAKSAWNKNFAAQLGAYDNALRENYEKYRMGNAYFGRSVAPEADWMASRSLSYLGS